MYLEKVAIDYLRNVNLAKIFKKYFVLENANKVISIKGDSNEFLEHREYYYSDDLKNVNWKLFARTEKLFSKVFSTEISKKVFILLDTSKSMMVGRKIPKIEYSKYLVSIVAYKLLSEGYKVVFATFHSDINNLVALSIRNFDKFDSVLLNIKCVGKTDFVNVISNLPNFVELDSNILMVSDLIFISSKEISMFRELFPKKDIVFFQVLSDEELSLLEEDFVEVVDPETLDKKLIIAKKAKKDYVPKMSFFIERIFSHASSNRISMVTFSTSVPYYVVLKDI
ncbi:MAG: DUF58 domain-containing protein [Brevinematia bacterium]